MELGYLLIRGARQHNLRIDELKIPKKKLVVFTGVSGSGKSSLAFDTLYAEGQRRYVESLSAYARQFLGQMEKPAYDKILGLSPTIAIEQKTASANPRSTVGTITEIYDHLRVLYARIGTQHCPKCDGVVEPLSTQEVVAALRKIDHPVLLLAPLVENRKGTHKELIQERTTAGFVRVRHNGNVERLEQLKLQKTKKHTLELVVDRFTPSTVGKERLTDSVETALREGQGLLIAHPINGETPLRLSQNRACTSCSIGLPELSPQSFSFNSPLGMCPSCNGLGRRTEMDPDLVVPDPSRSIHEGAIEPCASIFDRSKGWSYEIFAAAGKQHKIDFDKPWSRLSAKHKRVMLFGSEAPVTVRHKSKRGSGKYDLVFEGILNTMMRRFTATKSESMRRYYQQYFSEAECSECQGRRLRSESRAVRVGDQTIVEVSQMSVAEAAEHFRTLGLRGTKKKIASEVLKEISSRLGFLESVGLDYLTLDRSGPSLSGGEAQRIRLASQIGSELSGVMYVLDEPSIGLHERDNLRLLRTLEQLRDAGNSVIVVEHDAETIAHADTVVDFGPGAGDEGGHVVFNGTPAQLKRSRCLTGRYMAGKERIEIPEARRASEKTLTIRGAREHNLKGIDVAIPLGTLTAVTGVSGAGKSSLITSILYPALSRHLYKTRAKPGDHDRIEGLDQIDKAIHIDQSPIGRTPRSNPATYTKAFDQIRDLFAKLPESRTFGFKKGRFSFNVKGGRCEACEGDGVRRVQMHFLPDVFVPCEVCHGKRYNEATLRVRYKEHNIADVLALSVSGALRLFAAFPKLSRILQTLSDVGLDYIKLGQPATTLSGGEAQRIKLSRELARTDTGRTVYILDEPTTGLHFDDIKKLLQVLSRLVEAGNTVIVIEHNLDVIKCADDVIDLGPEGGEAGGNLVAQGTPEALVKVRKSFTGRCLKRVLPQ